MKPDLSTNLAGLELENPLLPGSGPPGDSLNKLKRLEKAGIGALVTKTISGEQPKVPRPKIAKEGAFLFNVEKWSEKHYTEWLREILPPLQDRTVPLLVSLGYTPEDLDTLIPLFDPLVDGFELSTHYISDSPTLFLETTQRARALTEKPIFMKLSWHAGDLTKLAVLCEEGGANGITAINSVGPVMSIDIHKRASRLGDQAPYMWLSGAAIRPLALRAVYDIAKAVKIPVIGCGGALCGADVIAFLLAGARAVQTCTGLLKKGPALIKDMKAEIAAWCEAQGVASLKEIIGTVTPHYVKPEKRP